jgi:hypothetical protein
MKRLNAPGRIPRNRRRYHLPGGEVRFQIGYSLLWRLVFFIFAISMLVASAALLVQTLLGSSEGLFVPSSMLVAAILMSIYLLPFISTGRQVLAVTCDGLVLVGHTSCTLLPWESIADARFKRVMGLLPYLVIRLSNQQRLVQFIDENPRSFLSKWTAHVAVLRWYPWILRRLFSVPSKMSTRAMLDWLERRYGGSLVIDFASLNGRGRELQRIISAHAKPPPSQ